jgi:PAS domain S-box-containing protein
MLMLLSVESEDSFRVVMVNQAVVSTTGRNLESLIGKTAREFLAGPVLIITMEKIQTALRSRARVRFLLSTRPSGRPRLSMEVILTPIRDPEGAGRHILVVARDITARITSEREIRRVMRELRDSEHRYRSLAEAANDQIFILDRDGRVLYVNSLASKLFQRPVSEIVGQTMHSLFPPAIAERQMGSVRSVFEMGEPSYREGLSVNPEGDIWLGTWLAPLRDSSGRITSVLGVARDITARIKSEKELRESEARFRAIFEKAAVGIVLIGLDGRLLECNETICEMLEIPRDELARQSLEFITHAEDRPAVAALVEAVAHNGRDTFQQELRLLRKNKVPVWCRLTVSEVLDSNRETVFLIGMVEDISKRLEAEQATRQTGESLRRYADRLETLHEIDRAILESHSPEEIAGATLERIHRLMPSQHSSLVLFDMEARTATVLDEYPQKEVGSEKGTAIPLSDYGSEIGILQTGELFSVEDMLTTDNPCAHLQRQLAAGVRTYLSLPLMSRSALIGALTIGSGIPAAFTREHSEIAAEVADLLAVAIQQARLFHQVRRHTFELESVAAFYQDLRQAPGRQEISEVVVRHTAKILQCEFVTLFEFDPANESFSVGRTSAPTALLMGERIPINNAFTRDVVSTGRPYADNHPQESAHVEYPELFRPLRSVACAPMFSRGFTVGALWIGRSHRGNGADITAEDLQLLESLGEVGGSALHRAALFEQTEQRLRRLSALRSVDMAISASIDLRVTLAVLLDQVATQLQVDAAVVRILNVPSQSLAYLAGRGIQSPVVTQNPLQLGEGFAGAAALQRRVIRVPQFAAQGNDYAQRLRESGEPFASYFVAPLLSKGIVKGVLELFSRKPFEPDEEWVEYLETMAAQAAIAIDNASLFDDLQRTNTDLITAYDATIEGWSRALELRDRETEGHTLRVTGITLRLARRVGIQEDEMIHVRRGALMHDIGKMGISDAILLKPGPLTAEETQVMRRHPVFAYEMLFPIGYLRSAIDIPYCHHEKWDGSGYPRGLKGEQIPLAARVFAIVDVWDALRNDRPYRKAWPETKVREYLRDQNGRHFDPAVVEAFFKVVDQEM